MCDHSDDAAVLGALTRLWQVEYDNEPLVLGDTGEVDINPPFGVDTTKYYTASVDFLPLTVKIPDLSGDGRERYWKLVSAEMRGYGFLSCQLPRLVATYKYCKSQF